MSAASDHLRDFQMQADADGTMVNVSRQALDETLAEYDAMLIALNAAAGYLTNAAIDLQTGAPKRTALSTIEGGLKLVRAALTKAEPALS